MIINKLVFLINVKDNFFEGALPSYKLTANNLNRDFVYVISPAVSSSVIYANFQSDLMNEGVDNVKMLLADETVDELVSQTAYYYETVKSWRVWKAPIPSRALRNIAMNRAGEIGISFSVKEIIVPESSVDKIDYFIRSDEDTMENDGVYLVEIAVYGEYRYRDVLIKSGSNVVVKRAIISTGNTGYVRYSVDGSIGIGEFEETIDEDIGVAIVSQLGNHEGRITSIEEVELVRIDNELLLLDSRVEDIEDVEIPRIDGELGSLDDRVSDVENVELPAINTELLRLDNVKAEKTSLVPINDELIRLDNVKAEKSEVYKKAQVYTQVETDGLLGGKVDKTTTVANINLKKNITASALVNNLREATDSLKGLMSADDKGRLDTLYTLLMSDDREGFVDTIGEILAIMQNYPEGVDLAQALGGKANKSNTYTKTEVGGLLDDKVDKVDGYGLSKNDYDDVEKGKVALLVDDGDGTKFKADDGAYKEITIPSIPNVEVNGGSVESGKYISQIVVDETNKHKLNITKANLPTVPEMASVIDDSTTNKTVSPKLVYDFVDDIVGDIETALDTILGV